MNSVKKNSFDFETTLKELSNIVKQFESEEPLTLDNAFKSYQDGVTKYLECSTYLDSLENEVTILNEKLTKN